MREPSETLVSVVVPIKTQGKRKTEKKIKKCIQCAIAIHCYISRLIGSSNPYTHLYRTPIETNRNNTCIQSHTTHTHARTHTHAHHTPMYHIALFLNRLAPQTGSGKTIGISGSALLRGYKSVYVSLPTIPAARGKPTNPPSSCPSPAPAPTRNKPQTPQPTPTNCVANHNHNGNRNASARELCTTAHLHTTPRPRAHPHPSAQLACLCTPPFFLGCTTRPAVRCHNLIPSKRRLTDAVPLCRAWYTHPHTMLNTLHGSVAKVCTRSSPNTWTETKTNAMWGTVLVARSATLPAHR